jgi:hypothetical protein
VLARSEIDAVIARASDAEFVKTKLRETLTAKRKSGKTKAALLLDELNLHADAVPNDAVAPLLTAIFSVADELHVESDRGRSLRHWRQSLAHPLASAAADAGAF